MLFQTLTFDFDRELDARIKWNHSTIYFKQMRLTIDRESKPLLYPIVNLSNFKKEIIHSGTLTPWCNLPFVEGKLHSLTKVMYPKYSKHWLSTVSQTIECVCSKISNRSLNHGLLFSLFKFFGWKNIPN